MAELPACTVKRLKEFSFFPVNIHPKEGHYPLYMVPPYTMVNDNGETLVMCGEEVFFDAFMSAFYEREFNEIVPNARMYLDVTLKGAALIKLFHRKHNGEFIEYSKRHHLFNDNGEFETIRLDFNILGNEDSLGRWFFTIRALDTRDVILSKVYWGIYDATVRDVKPCFLICTYKREEQVTNNVNQLLEFLKSRYDDYNILIIDNAQTLSRQNHWPETIRIIAQRNMGGAGGFGRGLYEIVNQNHYTHLCMLDDDADIEASSIERLLNLFALNLNPDIFIGGAELDIYDPIKLVECGVQKTHDKIAELSRRMEPSDLAQLSVKDQLMKYHPSNYNGWWLFGGSVESFKKYGMSIPCFIHFDDVDYGLRIDLKGGKTLSYPGIAVWHVPHYKKLEGWYTYYNIRNDLLRMACQIPLLYKTLLTKNSPHNEKYRKKEVDKRIAKIIKGFAPRLNLFFKQLLRTYQYASAALFIKGIEDFLKGPDIIIKEDAAKLHMSVMDAYKEFNTNYELSSDVPIGFTLVVPNKEQLVPIAFLKKTTLGKKVLSILHRNFQNITNNNRHIFQHRLPILLQEQREIVTFNNILDIDWRSIIPGKHWCYFDTEMQVGYHIFSCDKKIYSTLCKRFKKVMKNYKKKAVKIQPKWAEAYDNMSSYEFWSELIKQFTPPSQ